MSFDVDAELRAQLMKVGRQVVSRGLALASGGNLSVRRPGAQEFYVTGSGTWLDELDHGDFTRMTLDGEIVDGAAKPSSEWKLHQRTYRARPDVNAVIHLHPQHAVLVDAMGHEIRLLTLDHVVYVQSVGTVPFFPNGSDELADSAAEAAREHNCVILSHHGCSVVGEDVSMAYRRALNLEEAAVNTYRLLLAGDTTARFPVERNQVQHA